MEVVTAVTGASGAIYARRFLELTGAHISTVHLIVSEHGRQVVREELSSLAGPGAGLRSLLAAEEDHVIAYADDDLRAPLASGSSNWQAMVVIPCSMNTLGRIAAGVADSLITRAADVALKERRRLVLVCRETPLSLIHLRNMTRVTEAGAIVLPAAPGWYHHPRELGDLADFVVQKVYDALGIRLDLVPRWDALAAEWE